MVNSADGDSGDADDEAILTHTGSGGGYDALTANLAVTVTDSRPPMVSASCDPCTVSWGGEVRLTATASDPDGDALTYAWSARDGRFDARTDNSTTRWTAPDENGRVSIRVQISDGQGRSASATAEVKVINVAPQFAQVVYHFELAENQDGSLRPVALGRLTASDPEGDALTYDLVSGDRDLFAVGVEDGVVTYVGSGEDFETEPDRYDLTVSAQDAGGAEAGADVIVVVTDVNETPTVSASCDPCTVSWGGKVRLIATASDPDGDALTYAWSTPDGRFDARTDSSTTRWTAPDEDGRVPIRVQVSDGRGRSASATAEVEVVNAAPQFAQVVYRFELAENQDGSLRPVELGRLTASDPDGDRLTYDLVSGDRDLFVVGAKDGVVTYVGSGEDFETEPDRYDLAVRG